MLLIPEVAQGKPAVMDHIEALRNRKEIGNRVVVWGLTYGTELALSLARGAPEWEEKDGRSQEALW